MLGANVSERVLRDPLRTINPVRSSRSTFAMGRVRGLSAPRRLNRLGFPEAG